MSETVGSGAPPIHAPGAIQPHGVLLAFGRSSGVLERASANAASIFRLAPEDLAGRRPDQLLSPEIAAAIAAGPLPKRSTLLGLPFVAPDGSHRTLFIFAAGDHLIVEMEQEPEHSPSLHRLLSRMLAGADALRTASAPEQMPGGLVRLLRAVVGFDRVLIYRFDRDWNGHIIAEERSAQAPGGFLGMQFAEREIPASARALYLANGVRHIPDTDAAPIPILGLHGGDATRLDLTQSIVRANAPAHIAFLRNLGVKSAMSIAIDFDGHLWGLAVAHHYSPRHVPALRRVICQMIVSSFSARMHAVEESLRQREIGSRAMRVTHAARNAIERSGGDLSIALSEVIAELRAATGADGAFVRLGGVEARDGRLPVSGTIERIAGAADAVGGTLITDSLSRFDPSFSDTGEIASGVIARRLRVADDGVFVLVKGEIPEDIVWAGNPASETQMADGWPDPSRSIAPWIEHTRGIARNWPSAVEPVLDVAERAILDVWRTLSERRAHAELRARVDELRTIYENVEEGIALVDGAGEILSANARFGTLVDRDALSVIGARIDALIEVTDAAGAPVLGRETSRGRPRSASGIERPVEIHVTRAGTGDRPRHIVVLHDIAAREAFELDLVRAREAAERASRAKDEFLANMSHELRTPLTALLGYIDLLDQQIIDPTQRRWIETMRRSGWSLLRILSDVIDFARIEAGELRLEETMFDPVAKAHSILDLFRPTIDEKRLGAAVRVGPEVPRAVLGDAARVRQILSNLVGNAVKFTPSGAITIEIAAHRVGTPGAVDLEIVVADTGIGFAPDRLPHLFERFARIDRRLYGGVGLGLAISRRLARGMGGDLVAESAGEGKGARLQLRLPVRLAARVEPEAPAAAMPSRGARGRVLVIEDDRVNQELLAEMARILGFDPEIAGDGETGIRLATGADRYAALLVDVTLPGIDGLEATRRIRASRTPASAVPIVCITALASDRNRDDAMASGADAYLTKPVRLADLRAILDQLTAPK